MNVRPQQTGFEEVYTLLVATVALLMQFIRFKQAVYSFSFSFLK
jgi:hypothetical protein